MRALELRALEGPSGLHLSELPDLPADAGLVIDVHAAGVGFPELLLTRGEYQLKPPLPFVPGIEVAGVVRHAPVGSRFSTGQRVAAVTTLGGFAEQAIAIPDLTYGLADQVDFASAAALLINYQTALFALADRGGM